MQTPALHCALPEHVPCVRFRPQTLPVVSQTPLTQARVAIVEANVAQVPPGIAVAFGVFDWQLPLPGVERSLHHFPASHWLSVLQLLLQAPVTLLQKGTAAVGQAFPVVAPKSAVQATQALAEVHTGLVATLHSVAVLQS